MINLAVFVAPLESQEFGESEEVGLFGSDQGVWSDLRPMRVGVYGGGGGEWAYRGQRVA